MKPVPPINLTADEWEIVKAILHSVVPELPVWAFGSRASGKAKPFSDLDLAIVSTQALDWNTSAELAEAFAQSDLPFKVDLVDWSTCGAAFKGIIERDKVVLQ